MRLILATMLAMAPAAAKAQALPMTVGDMQRACAIASGEEQDVTPEGAIAVGACYGMMRGVVQVMQANCRSLPMGAKPAAALSLGDIPTAGDAIRAFAAWADANPAEAEAPAAFGVISALSGAYPCKG